MSASLVPECNEVKERYDSCFLKWYSEKYLKGESKSDECSTLLKKYNRCLMKGLRERGIDAMLDEVKESNAENDVKYLRQQLSNKKP